MDALYASILSLEAQTQAHAHQLGAALLANAQPSVPPENLPSTTDIWALQTAFSRLLDLYHDFIVAATTGNAKHLLVTYRIPRRLWIYGVVAFIEVLKNVLATNATPSTTNNMDVGPIFIVHAFTTISSLYEIDDATAWADKLAELARIAIQLYPANYLDWKLTAAHWYHQTTVLGSHGHGKLYYHQCTVEYDNLLAFTLLSKSLFCKDPFVPTQSYLQSIIDNVCSQRSILSPLEMAMIDFVKIHKILLLPDYNSNEEMKAIVGHYSTHFGLDSSNTNFFETHPEITNNILVSPPLAFWYSKAPYFAISNINHLLGLGNPLNLGSKVFGLVEKLKMRRDKKKVEDPIEPTLETLSSSQLSAEQCYQLLNETNKGVLQLSMNMLKTYLQGPILSSTPHVIIWLWFLISITKAPQSEARKIFQSMIRRAIPWKQLIEFINDIISLFSSRDELQQRLGSLVSKSHHNQNSIQLPLPLPINNSVASPSGTILTEESNSNSNSSDHDSILDSCSLLSKITSSLCDSNVETQLCYGTLWFDTITENPPPLRGPACDKSLLGELIPWDVHHEGDKWVTIVSLVGVLIESSEWPLTFSKGGQWVQYKSTPAMKPDEILDQWFDDQRLNHIKIANEQLKTPELDLGIFEGNVHDALAGLKWRFVKWKVNSPRFITDFVNGIFPSTVLENASHGQADPILIKDKKDIMDEPDEGAGYEAGDDSEDSQDHDLEHDLDQDEEYYYDDDDDGNDNIDDEDDDEDEGDDEDDLCGDVEEMVKGTNNNVSHRVVIGDLGTNMDTILTFLSLDTNIWLKFPGRIYKCVKNGIFRLCVPLTVFQELRSLRRSQDMNIADSATRAVLIIRQLYQEVDLLPLRSNGAKANSLNETLEFEQNPNWRVQSDDLIIQSINLSNQFGRDYHLGQGYKVGVTPQWPLFETPNTVGQIWSGAYMGTSTPSFAIRGQMLRSQCMESKTNILDQESANIFWYNVLVTDDKNMVMKSKTRGVKSFDSSWLWATVERVASGRCFN